MKRKKVLDDGGEDEDDDLELDDEKM